MADLIIPAIAASITAFLVVSATMPYLIRVLNRKGMTVKDVLKKGNVMIPRPAGPSLLAGIVASELVLYAFMR